MDGGCAWAGARGRVRLGGSSHATLVPSCDSGQKDGLQCVVVRRLIEDLNFNTELIVGETVREADGLAMSSRNVYLSPEQRLVAPAVYRSLCALEQLHASGERCAESLREAAMEVRRATHPAHAAYAYAHGLSCYPRRQFTIAPTVTLRRPMHDCAPGAARRG